jgi:hypothetical protein
VPQRKLRCRGRRPRCRRRRRDPASLLVGREIGRIEEDLPANPVVIDLPACGQLVELRWADAEIGGGLLYGKHF